MASNNVAQDVQEQILSTIRKSQEIALEALKSWVDTVQGVTEKIPSVDIPFADRLPKPQDDVASGNQFAEQILASQKKFANEVLEVAKPLLPGEDKSAS